MAALARGWRHARPGARRRRRLAVPQMAPYHCQYPRHHHRRPQRKAISAPASARALPAMIAATGADPFEVCAPPRSRDDRARPESMCRPTPKLTRAIATSIPPSRRPARDERPLLYPGKARHLQGRESRRRCACLSAGTIPTSRCSASGWRTTSASPSATGTRSPGRAATPSAARRSCGRGCTWPIRWRPRRRRRTSLSTCSACSTSPSSPFTIATSPRKARQLKESNRNVREIGEHVRARRWRRRRSSLLWGTANLFSNRRYMAGAATNPDPDVFAYAAAQVKNALELTHELGGANYVLWGGREGYETLLNAKSIKRRARPARPGSSPWSSSTSTRSATRASS